MKVKKSIQTLSIAALLGFTSTFCPVTAFASDTAITTQAKSETNYVRIKTETNNHYFYDNTMKEISSFVYHMPVLDSSSYPAKKINSHYKRNYNYHLKLHKKVVKEANDEYMTGDELTYDITFQNKRYLSILQEGYLYLGGAHGSPYYIPTTFDLRTGNPITLKSILTVSDTELNKMITDAFSKVIKDEGMDMFNEDALKTVKSTAGFSSPFYLTKEGITFYYKPYDLACYARGSVTATLTWDSLKSVLKIDIPSFQ